MSPTSEVSVDRASLALGLTRLPRIQAKNTSLLAALHQQLPEADLRQAEACHAGNRRIEFLTGRFVLRRILQNRFGLAGVRIETMPCGRPCLSGHSLSISVSHSSGWVAAGALSRGSLGIDVEGPREHCALPRRLGSMYHAAGVPEILVSRHWPLIEARAKCTGTSIGLLLQRPELCLTIDKNYCRGWFICDQYLMRYMRLPGAQLAICLSSDVYSVYIDRVALYLTPSTDRDASRD